MYLEGRSLRRSCELIAAGTLILTLTTTNFLTHPTTVLAASAASQVSHTILFDSQETQTVQTTTAPTVGDFLQQRGITPGSKDYVAPALDTPITAGMRIEYSAAVPVTIINGTVRKTILSNAGDVGSALEEQGIRLDEYDAVSPSLSDALTPGTTIHISRIAKWIAAEHFRIAPPVVRRIDFALAPGRTKIISPGRFGQQLAIVSFVSTNGSIRKKTLVWRVLRRPQARVVAEGVGTYAAFADFAARGLEKTSFIASHALDMVATAYTASCFGCSGYTARGFRAGRGIVAVDPRIIPLGTKLFIPGYGFAIAGDTGGDIVGYRIDLGFDSADDAIAFGRRSIKVYTLR